MTYSVTNWRKGTAGASSSYLKNLKFYPSAFGAADILTQATLEVNVVPSTETL